MEHLPPALRDRLASLDRLRAPETDTETLVRGVLAAACKLECRSPEAEPPDLSPLFAGLRADLAAAQERLREVILRHYDRVLEEVRQDVTVFAATNLALMLAAFLLALLKGRASVHLLPASLLLSLATLLMGSWYLVGQDWLLAAVFSDYWGYSYSVLAGLLAGTLLDIAFLQARITTFLLNLLLGLVGAATSIVPC